MSLKLRLTLLSFLQFAVWGAYLTSMGNYLNSVGLASKIGIFYAMQGIVSIFMPALVGIIADKWIPAQKLLGFCHFFAAGFLAAAGYYGMVAGDNVEFYKLFILYGLSVMFYMPSIALSNSVAYTLLKRNNFDTIKVFPAIRTFGTVGFIIAMLFVDFAGYQESYIQFYVSAIIGLFLFVFCLFLPNCPVTKSDENRTFADALGLKAFSLFKDRKMAIFFIFSMLLGVSLQITNGYANPFITSFKGIPGYENTWGANHANALISISQISETLCILLIPYFLKRFGIKSVMLMAMFAWVLRFAFFGLGDPGSKLWLFVSSMIIYGIAFDFFNVSGSLFVDKETDKSIRSSAQGVFMMMTNGFGATIGMLGAQEVVNHFVFSQSDPLVQLEGWQTSWYIFAIYALIVTILFAIMFKHKHDPKAVASLPH